MSNFDQTPLGSTAHTGGFVNAAATPGSTPSPLTGSANRGTGTAAVEVVGADANVNSEYQSPSATNNQTSAATQHSLHDQTTGAYNSNVTPIGTHHQSSTASHANVTPIGTHHQSSGASHANVTPIGTHHQSSSAYNSQGSAATQQSLDEVARSAKQTVASLDNGSVKSNDPAASLDSSVAQAAAAIREKLPAVPSLPPSDREEPNLPKLAEGAYAKVPTAEEIKSGGVAAVDRATELAAQAKAKAGELVQPADHDKLNETEAHVDNLSRGIAGMIVTAPLAGIEKISPVVADKLAAAADQVSAQLQGARDNVVPAASSYAQQATEYAKSFLPASLGGTAQPAAAMDNAASNVSQTASNVASSAQQSASSAGTTASSYLPDTSNLGQKVTQTAQAYLPESIGSKLPGATQTGALTTETDAEKSAPVTTRETGHGSTASQTPYVPVADNKQPTTTTSSVIDNFTTGSTHPNPSQYTGLAPDSTSSPAAKTGSGLSAEEKRETVGSAGTIPSYQK